MSEKLLRHYAVLIVLCSFWYSPTPTINGSTIQAENSGITPGSPSAPGGRSASQPGALNGLSPLGTALPNFREPGPGLALTRGDEYFYASIIDTEHGYAYFGTHTTPGAVVKIRLSDFSRVGALTLNTGENSLWTAVLDEKNGYAYFGAYDAPGFVVKIRLSDFSRVGALALNESDYGPASAVLDTANGYAYFGMDTSPGIVLRVRLSDFSRVDELTLHPGEDYLWSALLDPLHGYAYFASFTEPSIIAKVDLRSSTYLPLLNRK
jgi:hypothetical protein